MGSREARAQHSPEAGLGKSSWRRHPRGICSQKEGRALVELQVVVCCAVRSPKRF